MAFYLIDDGTLDTVVKCDGCGEEVRFNYDGMEPVVPGEDAYSDEELDAHYDAFIKWAIESASQDHVCGEDTDDEPTHRLGCDSCALVAINGVICRETGCRNAPRTCKECGQEVARGESCCADQDLDDSGNYEV